ncbi:unnamed protein product [Lymnaea stagnalis]|uniref:Elongator complex protein 6 n=1 Tax=Lymnaea stagnalis TaxID=6523 RepID=A0AAV2HVD7_LYMST
MLAQISQFLAVDPSNFPKNEHIIVGDRSQEGGFLIHYFLNLCLKQKRPVVFVGLSQSFSHYNTVAQKLGTNLLLARDENKNLIFIEGLNLLSDCVRLYPSDSTESNSFFSLLKGDITFFLEEIGKSISNFTKLESPNAPVVIVDDLFILLRAGATTRDIIYLVDTLYDLLTSGPNKGSLILLSHLENSDDETDEAWAYMRQMCSIKIEVSDLKSGYCKDVHGQVCTVNHFDQ